MRKMVRVDSREDPKGDEKITCVARVSRVASSKCNRFCPTIIPAAKSSSTGRSRLYVKKNSYAASITNKVSNNSAKKRRAPHQISPPYFSTTFDSPASPPFPSRPGISIPIDCRSEALPMDNNCRHNWGKRTETSRRMSLIVRHPATD